VATQPSRTTSSPARRSTPVAPPATATLGAGRFGPFRLLERLHGAGPVEQYHALWSEAQTPSERLCLLRRLPLELGGSIAFSRMFQQEARIMGRLCHPNVVRAYAAGEIEGAPYLALEYLDGLSLAQVTTARRVHRQKLPLEVAVFIAHEVAAALGYAYDALDDSGQPMHLVHGDVRPARVAICSSGEVKLTDLGAARVVSFVRATGPAPGVKPLHAAPELLAGATPDLRSDLFSLGVLLWELVCNQPLFPSVTSVRESAILRPSRLRADLPPAVDGLIMQLLERNPARRRTTAEEVRRTLAPLVPVPADAERALAAMIRDGTPARRTFHRLPARGGSPAAAAAPTPAPRASARPAAGGRRRPITRVVPALADLLLQQGEQLARALPESVRKITGLVSPVPIVPPVATTSGAAAALAPLHARAQLAGPPSLAPVPTPTPAPPMLVPLPTPTPSARVLATAPATGVPGLARAGEPQAPLHLLAFTSRPRSRPRSLDRLPMGWLRRLRAQLPRLAVQVAMVVFVAFLAGVVWQEIRTSGEPTPQLVETESSARPAVSIQPLDGPTEIVVVEPAPRERPSRPRASASSSRPRKAVPTNRTRPARSGRGTAH
jgi:serine/threonine-protein kinase